MKKSKRIGRTDALRITCMNCGAAIGECCRGIMRKSTGKRIYRTAVHVERLRDAENIWNWGL